MEREEVIDKILAAQEEIMRFWKAQFFALIKDEGLTPAQVGVLLVVAESQPATTKKLADLLHQTPSAVSQAVDPLVQSGLILRESDPQDRRITYLRLTEPAEAVIDRVRQKRHELYAEAAKPLTIEELRADLERQRKVLTHLKQHTA